eukprot:SAG31_NODE_548_length_14222_cov_10.926574_2_plen_218_part_00
MFSFSVVQRRTTEKLNRMNSHEEAGDGRRAREDRQKLRLGLGRAVQRGRLRRPAAAGQREQQRNGSHKRGHIARTSSIGLCTALLRGAPAVRSLAASARPAGLSAGCPLLSPADELLHLAVPRAATAELSPAPTAASPAPGGKNAGSNVAPPALSGLRLRPWSTVAHLLYVNVARRAARAARQHRKRRQAAAGRQPAGRCSPARLYKFTCIVLLEYY